MLTKEALVNYGADYDTGFERCMKNEDFYFKLIKMAVQDGKFADLNEAIAANDLDKAFEAAHALKGTTGNLSLNPIFLPMSEMTELLRSRTEMDYSEYLKVINDKLEELKAICG